MLDNYRQRLTAAGNQLVLAGVQPQAAATLTKTGFTAHLGSEHLVGAGPDVTRSLDDAWHHAIELTNRD